MSDDQQEQTTNTGNGPTIPQDIFSMLGLQDLPEKEKKVLLKKLEKVIQERAIHMIVSQLTDDQCKDLNERMDQGMGQDEVIGYLRTTIPDLDEKIRGLVEEFRDELILEVDDIRQELASGKKPSSIPVKQRNAMEEKVQKLTEELQQVEARMVEAHQANNAEEYYKYQEQRENLHKEITKIEKKLAK